MQLYKKMYLVLFNAITSALRQIDENDFLVAKEILVTAQKKTEEIFLEENAPDLSSGAFLFLLFYLVNFDKACSIIAANERIVKSCLHKHLAAEHAELFLFNN